MLMRWYWDDRYTFSVHLVQNNVENMMINIVKYILAILPSSIG